MPGKHSILGPSSAHRWMRCAGSAAAEDPFRANDQSSSFADEGTAAHELAALALEKQMPCDTYVGLQAENGVEFTLDMARDVQKYVDAINDYALEKTLFIENELSIEYITGEPEAMGTSDAIVIDTRNAELQVHDLKFGRGVEVNAWAKDDEGKIGPNEQMALYALGALNEYGDFCELKTVLMVIHQPRLGHLSEHRMTLKDLLEFGKTAKAMAGDAWLIYKNKGGEYKSSLKPGDKQCRFCKAKATCPALRSLALKTIADDFVDIENEVLPAARINEAIEKVDTSADEALDKLYPLLDLIDGWGRAVLSRIEKRLLEGKRFENCKLVQGKRGSRKWVDAKSVEAAMKAMRLKREEMYDFSLISPTSADKLLAKENPKRWATLQSLITQSPGSPSVAPASDKREALKIMPPQDDFIDEDDGSDLVG